MRRLPASLLHCRRGSALVELALVVPILVSLFLGCVEVTRYVLLQQKLDRAAMSLGDLASRGTVLDDAAIADVWLALPRLVAPFDLSNGGRAIVSAVGIGETGLEVTWQRSGAGSATAVSRIGAPGGSADLPGTITPRAGERIFVAEVFYDFEPFFVGRLFPESRLYHRSVWRGRLSDSALGS